MSAAQPNEHASSYADLDATDRALVDGFERQTLQPASFRHREHLHVAWCYLRMLPFEEAAARFERHLVRYANAHGASSKIDLPLTWAYLGLVAEAIHADQRRAASFDELLERHPDLLERRLSRARAE